MLGPKSTCVLQKPTETVSSTGSVVQTVEDLCSFKAVLVPLKPEEKRFFDKETVFADYRLMFDYKTISALHVDEVSEENSIRCGEQAFDIVGVINYHNRHFEVELLEIT